MIKFLVQCLVYIFGKRALIWFSGFIYQKVLNAAFTIHNKFTFCVHDCRNISGCYEDQLIKAENEDLLDMF